MAEDIGSGGFGPSGNTTITEEKVEEKVEVIQVFQERFAAWGLGAGICGTGLPYTQVVRYAVCISSRWLQRMRRRVVL